MPAAALEGKTAATRLADGDGDAWLRLFSGVGAVAEYVAGRAHGADRVALVAADERLAQASDVHIDGALVDEGVAAPRTVGMQCSGSHSPPYKLR